MSKKYQAGEIIHLVFDDYPQPEFYVRGHMPPLVARKLLEKYYGYDVATDKERKMHHIALPAGLPHAIWGRWTVGHGEDGPQQFFEPCALPGKGRFPVMALFRREIDDPTIPHVYG